MRMNNNTVNAYNSYSKEIAEFHRSQIPETARRFALGLFKPQGKTLDLGCGTGRDSAWLFEKGFNVDAADASEGMLKEAKSHYGNQAINFYVDSLPELAQTENDCYDNVFCNAVFMHIEPIDLYKSAKQLSTKIKVDGILILSFRNSKTPKDVYGREFYNINHGHLISIFGIHGLNLVKHSVEKDSFDEYISWHVLTFCKTDTEASKGIHQVASILENDSKSTTYKYALLRSLCTISKYDSDIIRWVADNKVLIPMASITYEWIKQYWPIVLNDKYIMQGKDDFPGKKQLVIRKLLEPYKLTGKGDLNVFLQEVDADFSMHTSLLTKVSRSIIEGPIKHSGGAGENSKYGNTIFVYEKDSDSLLIPGSLWQDIEKHSHWIEDSIILRWARHTITFNSGANALKTTDVVLANPEFILGKMFELLSTKVTDERDTKRIREIIDKDNVRESFHCVWTGKPLLNEKYDVDHVIPYIYWGNNDLWNMIPSLSRINRSKSDKMPSEKAIRQQRNQFYFYWDLYHAKFPQLFATQINRALGCKLDSEKPGINWKETALDKMVEKVETFTKRLGVQVWKI